MCIIASSHSIKIHDLSDLKGVYTIIDIEEDKGKHKGVYELTHLQKADL